MKIINKTKWLTKDLRTIITRSARQEIDDPAKRKRLLVTVTHSRNNEYRKELNGGLTAYGAIDNLCYSGCARVGGRGSTLRIPSVETTIKVHGKPRLCAERIAMVAAHEFRHNRGVHGERTMNNGWHGYKCLKGEVYAWARDIVVGVKEEKPKRDVVAENEAAAREREKYWEAEILKRERRVKSAKKILQAWRKKVRYYDRLRASRPENINSTAAMKGRTI